MNDDLDRLSSDVFDVVVVGGGILGAFLAHECARLGLGTALLERGDYAGGTTSASGKVLHGGLRYLQHLELGLAAESNREQRRLAELAPGLVRPLPFLVPARSGRPTESLKLRGGAWAWRLAGAVLPGDGGLPPPGFVGAAELEEVLGPAATDGLGGGMRFHDHQIRSPERLTIALVCRARDLGAAVANYVEVEEVATSGDAVEGVRARDRRSGRTLRMRGRVVVNAAGPAGASLAASVDGSLRRTAFAKGVHVVLDRPEPPAAVALPLSSQSSGSALGDERRVFVVPWEGRTLVGATYEPFDGDPLGVRPDEAEVRGFLGRLSREWPGLGLDGARPLYAYAGLYPIFGADRAAGGRFEASLRPRIVDHGARGGPRGLVSAVSVKLTGARKLADEVMDVVREKLGASAAATPGRATELPRATPTPLADGEAWGPDTDVRSDRVGEMVETAVRDEMAVTLPDFLFRRTWAGHYGPPDDDIHVLARRMGGHLGWDASEVEEQVARAREVYRAVHAWRTPAPKPGAAGPTIGREHT